MTAAEIQDLRNFLALFLEHPRALRVLAGETQPPEADELASLGVRKKTMTQKLMGRRRAAEGG
jgi:hypothetical protein